MGRRVGRYYPTAGGKHAELTALAIPSSSLPVIPLTQSSAGAASALLIGITCWSDVGLFSSIHIFRQRSQKLPPSSCAETGPFGPKRPLSNGPLQSNISPQEYARTLVPLTNKRRSSHASQQQAPQDTAVPRHSSPVLAPTCDQTTGAEPGPRSPEQRRVTRPNQNTTVLRPSPQ